MTNQLEQIAADYFTLAMSRDPFEASLSGISEFDAEIPDVTEVQRDRDARTLADLRARLTPILSSRLSSQDNLTASILASEMHGMSGDLDARWTEFTVDAALSGPQARVLSYVPKVPLATNEQQQSYLSRCSRVADYMRASLEQIYVGISNARPPTARGVIAAVTQIDAYLNLPISDDPFIKSAVAAGASDAYMTDLTEIIEHSLRPGIGSYRSGLYDRVLRHARADDRIGLVGIAGGDQVYRAALRRHTTTSLTPDEVHATGLQLVEALSEETRTVASNLFPKMSPVEVFTELRRDPLQRFDNADQIVSVCREALGRSIGATPLAFHQMSNSVCDIRLMPTLEGVSSTMGYYQPPRNRASSATFWLNGNEPASRTRYEYEALTFHEAVPGHHTQITLAQGLKDLPAFRRFGYIVAFCEGWALYAERLARELDLYTNVRSLLGMLSFALWRSARLVVDTGLHDFGWPREQALDYMTQATGLTRINIQNELDRYIGWPGQATGYMIGCQEFTKLRGKAYVQLGAAFNLTDFHSIVLGSGPMPLATLADQVDRWIDGTLKGLTRSDR